LLLFSFAAHASAPPTQTPETPLTMTVRGVGTVRGSDVVLLETPKGKRLLPIWIGPNEAQAIDMRLRGVKPARPLTHDLIDRVLVGLGAKIDRIEVDDLRDEVFHGKITLRDAKGNLVRIDARPSDLIALAVGAGLPIHVAPHVLQQAGIDADKLQP
jgi:bifunctional DNase/RNase